MRVIFFLLLFLGISKVYSQKYTISGYIVDALSGERLIGANVYDANTIKGVSTNNYGFYSFTSSSKRVQLTVSYVGFTTYTTNINLNRDTVLNISLIPSISIDEVIVERSRVNKVHSSQMSVIDLPMKTANKLPVIFGESDIIKTLQLLPGVQSGGEAMSGMYVRGGGADQNLILLDGVPVYNANHLFGFFSVFNSDAIQSVKLTKGAFPARYGGRLSSVLDIHMKEGNDDNIGGTASIGLISSKFMINGPLDKKTTFLVSARRTYVDVLATPYLMKVKKDKGYDKYSTGYYFYDINAKINHKFNDKHRIYLSTYTGKDKYYYLKKESGREVVFDDVSIEEWPHLDTVHWASKLDNEMWWSNTTAALRWNYVLSNKLFMNTTATYSWYKMETSEMLLYNTENSEMKYNSHIEDIGIKLDFDYFPSSNHNIKFGISEIYHTFNPGVVARHYVNTDTIGNSTLKNNKQYTHELAAYIEDDINIGSRLKANIGIRWSGFKVGNRFYNNFEPRMSARLLITDSWSIKGAYAEMNQYVNLLVNSNIGLPLDLWVPTTENIVPQESQQISFGSVYAINNQVDFSIEAFHKKMNNLIEYKEGASFLSLGSDWQTNVTQGKGWAYGLELLLMKRLGNTTGWIGYTWSKSERKFDKDGEQISFGKVFPYKYDRKHDASIVVSHKINNRIDIGGTWVYGTGNAITLPYIAYPSEDQRLHSSQGELDNNTLSYPNIDYIESRNNFRMPAYHRLDFSVNFKKEKKWGQRIWNISIYNIYNRQNPFMVGWDIDLISNEKKLMQYSLFQMIPSLTYKVEF